jgi:hypothetical protein
MGHHQHHQEHQRQRFIIINRLEEMERQLTGTSTSEIHNHQSIGRNGKTTECESNGESIIAASSSRHEAIGKRLSFLPNVILTYIWHFFNLKGIAHIHSPNHGHYKLCYANRSYCVSCLLSLFERSITSTK